jgi:SET domain-containing protein
MWKVKKSKVHGSGVFATKDIKKNTKIIEYIGEKFLNQRVIRGLQKE